MCAEALDASVNFKMGAGFFRKRLHRFSSLFPSPGTEVRQAPAKADHLLKRFDKRALTFVGWRHFARGPVTEEHAERVVGNPFEALPFG